MYKHRIVFTVALLCSGITVLAQPKTPKAQKSLYHRLGGYDAIAAVVDDALPRVVSDPLIAPFFRGHSADSTRRTRQGVVDLLCQASGGPCFYTGRSMKTAHEGLAITDEHWQVLVKHLSATLEKFKVPDKEQSEVLAIVAGLRPDIVAGAAKK